MDRADEGSFERKGMTDLLIVMAERGTYVVEAPAHMACVGSLVSFAVSEWTHTGEVVEMMTCDRDDPAYRCMSRVAEIRKATKIYCCIWPEILKD